MAVSVDSAGAASVEPTSNTIQPPTEGSEEARFAVTSVTMEAAMTAVTVPEVPATISSSTAHVVDPTSARDELTPISRPVIERGSGSISSEFSPANDIMGELHVKWCSSSSLPCDHVSTSSSLGAVLSNLPECFSRI